MLEVGTIRDNIQEHHQEKEEEEDIKEHREEEDNRVTAAEVVEQRAVMTTVLVEDTDTVELLELVTMEDTVEEEVTTVLSTPVILQLTVTVEDRLEEVHQVEDSAVKDTRTTPTPTTVNLGQDSRGPELALEVP